MFNPLIRFAWGGRYIHPKDYIQNSLQLAGKILDC